VRDEELDWEIYHALQDPGTRSIRDLEARGYDLCQVEASLGRLEQALLIERRGDTVHLLSIPESILLCQLKNVRDGPLFIENGVIRVRNGKERKP